MTNLTKTFQQNKSIYGNADRASPYYKMHRDAFLRGSYVFGNENNRYELCDSIVVPQKQRQVFAQLSIGLTSGNQLVVLFFCEPFGSPTAIFIGDSFEKNAGSDDPYEHEVLFQKWRSVIYTIYDGLIKRKAAKAKPHAKVRRIAIGASKHLGHSLINDLSGLYYLLNIIDRSNVLCELSIFSKSLFDALATKSLNLKKDIFSKEEELINFYQKWDWENEPYFVKPMATALTKPCFGNWSLRAQQKKI